MNKDEILNKVKKAKENLENAKRELNNAKKILDEDITFNNTGFKSNDINNCISKVNSQLNNINNKIISEINNM